MRIAVDARPLGSGDSVRGIGVYTRELLGAYGRLGYKDIEVLEEGPVGALGKFDLVHFTSFNPFRICVPFTKPKGAKFILTIYDLIPLVYPDRYRPGIKGAIRLAVNNFLIRKNVDAVLTISETSKKDICRFIGIDPKNVHVIHLSFGSSFRPILNTEVLRNIALKYKLPKKFILYTGDVNYNKNIPVLLEAVRLAGIPLVIVGKRAKEVENLNFKHAELRHLEALDWSDVTRLGFVPDEDLAALYNLAAVYVQPSLYEGFGLPVLEAFACGTPVVAAKTQALVEIAEGVALFSDPKSPEDFADKIRLVVGSKKIADELSKKGLARAKEFAWEKTAQKAFELYKNI